VDFIEVFLREVLTAVGYILLFVVAYKVFQVSRELQELRQWLKDRAQPGPLGLSKTTPSIDDLGSEDASAYAEKLLRAVNAESRPSVPAVPPGPSEPR
jgi:hypothetical protein